VDGQVYQWLGNDTGITPAKTGNTYLTATRTMFRMEAGPVSLNVSFLSPVEVRFRPIFIDIALELDIRACLVIQPTNLVRQSFPFAYVYVDVSANDGQTHSVQLYTDVSACKFIPPSLAAIKSTNRTYVCSSDIHAKRHDGVEHHPDFDFNIP
jgi:hypothetical protein